METVLEAAFNAEQQKTLTVIAGGNARAAEVPLMNRNRAKHHAEITKLYTKAQGYLARMNTIATTPSGISTYFGICGCHMCGTDRALTGNSADHVERQRVCGLDLARLNLIVQARNADIV